MKRLVSSIRKSLKSQKGFTLIELLVVVAILGVLAAVVVPNVASFMNKGNLSAAKAEAASVQTAVDAYMTDHNATVPSGTTVTPSDSGILATYLRSSIKATYSVSTTGVINGTGNWNGDTTITWDAGNNTWKSP